MFDLEPIVKLLKHSLITMLQHCLGNITHNTYLLFILSSFQFRMASSVTYPSIKERIVVASNTRTYHPLQTACRPQKYKHWKDNHLEAACTAIKSGISVRQAAEEFCIPKSTLHDHVTGKILPGSKSGQKYLTDNEEEELVTFLVGCSDVGYPRTRKDILCLVQNVMEEKGKKLIPTSGWWEGFKSRHPELTLRTAEQLAQCRARSCSKETFMNYFDLLEKTMEDNELISTPTQIFNCDETGIPLDPKPPKAIVLKGVKHPRTITTGNKAQITVLACCSAAGYVLPPFVVYDRKTLKSEMYTGEVPGTMYGLSDSGWMTSELFDLWFVHHFLPHAPSARPLLLLLDGHSSHYNPAVIRKAAEEKVIMFCLPPHSSHESQPLDIGPFGPLKASWREVCQQFLAKNPGKVVTRFTFSKLFNEAWCSAMNMKNVVAGFRYTGIYPLNRSALIPEEKEEKEKSLAYRTGLKFIPLYSPLRYNSRKSATCIEFTEEEAEKFQRRFEEGYDLDSDEHYNSWKQFYHPTENDSSPSHINTSDNPHVHDVSTENTNDVLPDCTVSSDTDISGVSVSQPLYPNLSNTAGQNYPELNYSFFPWPQISSSVSYDQFHQMHPYAAYAGPYSFPQYQRLMPQANYYYPAEQPTYLPKITALSKILQQGPPMKLPDIPKKTSGKVLTSIENIKAIENKEKKKVEEEQRKLERREKGINVIVVYASQITIIVVWELHV